jgi:DnaJ-class molecular chaperone
VATYYDILNLPRSASGPEVRDSYRSSAIEHHPAQPGADGAARGRFMDISTACAVLGDSEARNEYDARIASGEACFEQAEIADSFADSLFMNEMIALSDDLASMDRHRAKLTDYRAQVGCPETIVLQIAASATGTRDRSAM